MNDTIFNAAQNKNANNKFDVLYKIWLSVWFVVKPLPQEEDEQDLQQVTETIRELLDKNECA